MATRIVTATLVLALAAGGIGAEDGKGKPKAPVKEGTVADAVAAGEWTLASVSVRKGTISLCEGRAAEPGVERAAYGPGGYLPLGASVEGLPVAADAEVSLDKKPAKLADLKREMRVKVRLGKDPVRVTKVEATSPEEKKVPAPTVWRLQAADPKAKRLTVTSESFGVTLKDLAVTEETAIKGHALSPSGGAGYDEIDLASPAFKEGTNVGLVFAFDAKAGTFTLARIDVGVKARGK